MAKKGYAYDFLRGHTTPFKLLVAYVASNHLLYGVHTLAGTGKCPEAENTAGVGGMLVSSNRTFLRELFNEHRLADVLVHGGG